MTLTEIDVPRTDSSRRDVIGKITAALFTFSAATIIKSRAAGATHVPPTGCYGYGVCHCCNSCGTVRADFGCPSGTGCWYYVDSISCRTYKCCDYYYLGQRCLCRSLVCSCC